MPSEPMPASSPAVTPADITAAHDRIRDRVRRTPVLTVGARQLGLQAEIFMPSTSPPFKRERIASYGADIHVIDPANRRLRASTGRADRRRRLRQQLRPRHRDPLTPPAHRSMAANVASRALGLN